MDEDDFKNPNQIMSVQKQRIQTLPDRYDLIQT